METHSSVLAWRIPGTGSLVGCHQWGHTESDTTEVMQQQQQQLLSIRTLLWYDFNFTVEIRIIPISFTSEVLKWKILLVEVHIC